MGNEESTLVDEDAEPLTLDSRDLDGLAKYIRSGRVKNVVIMSGAGISTSAGIPDFRSPKTGLYANLAALNLPHPEAVFDISFFRNNPIPFYALANELYPGKFTPTIAHSFIRLLHQKGLLLKHFTQNIDCLDRAAGVPGDKIIEAHGSFARQSCIKCKASFPKEDMLIHVDNKIVPRCLEKDCDGLVKPEIVFFGEALPSEFLANRMLPEQADLVIVMGTSLTVAPFNTLPAMASNGTPRVLMNMERVGSLGSRADDVLLLGSCDDGVCKLADACGWLDELVELWEEVGGKVDKSHPARQGVPDSKKTKDEAASDEVDKLVAEIDSTLKISASHEEESRDFVEKMARARSPNRDAESKKTEEPQPGHTERSEAAQKSASPEVILKAATSDGAKSDGPVEEALSNDRPDTTGKKSSL